MFQNNNLNELLNKYRENKLAHAYLIETNDNQKALTDIKKFIKILDCPHNYQETCSNCNLCNLIEKDNLPSIKIIEPQGANIKKEQIESLKNSFSTMPVYSKYNIYIIKNADKLNPSSANSMLKFLEEPTDGIIGFFLTSNKDVIMDTIKSRCQTITLKYENNTPYLLDLTDEEYNDYLQFIKNYLHKLNSNDIVNHKKDVLTKFPERKDVQYFLEIIFDIYYQNFLNLLSQPHNENLVKIVPLNYKEAVFIKKLNIITSIINKMSYNINMEQALDKFVIEMRDSNG